MNKIKSANTQDYDVSDIQCSFSDFGDGSHSRDVISARLRKPEGFRGSPLFADDRQVDPLKDSTCQIRPVPGDPTELSYNLLITDFNRCGVAKRNGFVHVRIWFPQFTGVVMMSDQDLVIMCKPPEPTIIENKAAGFAGSLQNGARVSGVVEETPGRLEYEVALYKEAPPTRLANKSNELPVDQAVPIGTKLQLRARINPESAWKFVKLMEVTVSPDPDEPHSVGSVALVKNGCRNLDFASIIPHQPARYRDRHNEVFLDFEAFLLSAMSERSTLWIHSQIKACMDAIDCKPEYCVDLFEPSGHGRRRRRTVEVSSTAVHNNDSSRPPANDLNTQSTKFNENIEYAVLMPQDFYQESTMNENSCNAILAVTGVLGCIIFVAALVVCYLASRLHTLVAAPNHRKGIEEVVRDHSVFLHDGESNRYTGRSTLQ
ncbi:Uncharacterized protein GBIM_14865 [Gryllus bimaculatus]|nr:Uncharacterized protein GBIM_14865 [Gryllus bimaculatus]